ncbi:MAG: single-stranded DNA-binding protein [Steroidobacteraceae bacterium]
MKLIGLIRLGRDAEIRYTTQGTPVAELSGAWNYGRKGDDGKRPTQWAKFTLWGERAESLQEYLLKGAQLLVVVGDVHIETFDKRDGGQGFNLVGRIEDLQFAGGGQQQQGSRGRLAAAAPARAPATAPRPPAAAPRASNTGSGFDDMDDDIPF